MIRKYLLAAVIMLPILAWPGPALAEVDYSIYADLLGRYVHNGVVDYAGFKKNEARLDQFLAVLEKTDINSLSRDEQFALYINAYNAWTIKLILTEYPGVKSIKDLGSLLKDPWKIEFLRLGGKVITLDDIEHGLLRTKFKDPRIHFAVNCASKSCPPLLSKPYLGRTINPQLDQVTTAFLNTPHNTYLAGKTLYLSRIFKWYKEDFPKDQAAFVLKYARGEFKKRLEENKGEITIKYLAYDWNLNGN